MEPVKLGSVLDFLRLLWAVDHALQSRSKQMVSALGITGPQRLTLRIVGKFPGVTATELAAILHLHKSTLSGILERLERRGLLRRAASREDARRVRLTLTPSGRRLNRVQNGTVEAAARRVLARIPARDLATAAAVLEQIATELQALQPP
jgi:DNA-binding MarR family transcriptional regulator